MTVTAPSDVIGNFKSLYGDKLVDLIPQAQKLQKLIPFVPKDQMIGLNWNIGVILASNQSYTYAQPDAGGFDLLQSIPMKVQNAQVSAYQLLARSSIAYDVASRASKAGPAAFAEATSMIVEDLFSGCAKRLDLSMLHGQSLQGIGTIAIGDFDETAPSATTATFVVEEATWASGVWTGSVGAALMFYSDVSYTIGGGANLNANATTDKVFITAVNSETRTISVSSSADAIEDINDVSATKALTIYFDSAVQGTGSSFEYNEMPGLKRIMTNSGTLFNINAAIYDLWRGNSVPVTGQLTFGKIQLGIARAVNRGLEDDVVVFVNPDTWSDLLDDLAALRMFDSSYKESRAENGAREIVFYGQNGMIKIIPYNIVFQSECFIFPVKKVKRIGSQDIGFGIPGTDMELLVQLESKAAYDIRCYTAQSVFCDSPCQTVYISGFTNSSGS